MRLSILGLVATTLSGLANAVSVPNCSCQAAPVQKVLNVTTGQTPYLGVGPFSITYARQPNVAFVTLAFALVVLNTSTFVPTVQHEYPFSIAQLFGSDSEFNGLTLTPDGSHLLITTGSRDVVIINTDDAISGQTPLPFTILNGTAAAGGANIEVAATSHYAFVSSERGSTETSNHGTVEVYDLHRAPNASLTGSPIGFLPLGIAVVGFGFSPDHRILYATSEEAVDAPLQCRIRGAGGTEQTADGTLSVLSVPRLTSSSSPTANLSSALLATVPAGCNVNRVTLSPDGETVWLSARESNALTVFSTRKLRTSPSTALLATVQVGTSPIGSAFFRHGKRLLTADSNRWLLPNATTGLSVVDTEAALRGESRTKAVLGRIPTGAFPRDIAVSPDGKTALVVLFNSSAVQAVDLRTVP